MRRSSCGVGGATTRQLCMLRNRGCSIRLFLFQTGVASAPPVAVPAPLPVCLRELVDTALRVSFSLEAAVGRGAFSDVPAVDNPEAPSQQASSSGLSTAHLPFVCKVVLRPDVVAAGAGAASLRNCLFTETGLNDLLFAGAFRSTFVGDTLPGLLVSSPFDSS